MFKRLVNSWGKHRLTAERAEAHLARIAEQLSAAEARASAWADRVELQLRQLNALEIHLGRVEHQLALSHPRFASPLRLEPFGRKIFSQGDEDGIIAEIFRRIGEGCRVFVEIAAGNGRENCSAFLLSQGWRGLWVECDDENVRSIQKHWANEIASGQLRISPDFVTRDTVNGLIAGANLGDEIDILIMDVDGNDYHLLEALEARPRVICAEYIGHKPPPVRWVMPYDENYDLTLKFGAMTHGVEYGASLQALDDLLTPRGYSLVGTSIAGVNCFFVRSDLVEDKFEAPFTAYNHYNPVRYWYPTLNFVSQVWMGPADALPPRPNSAAPPKASKSRARMKPGV
jgi:hypothetical protein